jgi:CO/xanthine dehydrogenase Mo-binding subunit
VVAGEPLVEVHTAAAEVGQGLVSLQAQIARTELGVERVVALPADTQVGSAGSSSASRQSWMTGGAVKAACEAVRSRVLELAAAKLGDPSSSLSIRDGEVVGDDDRRVALADLLAGEGVEETREYHHRETQALDPEAGQGEAHVAFAFAAHRAVVDVDTELGLVKMVEIATTQGVGKARPPRVSSKGGIAQGLGLALMEEVQVVDGEVRNPSFTDYLIPTMLDMPPVRLDVLELGHPDSPYGLRGIGEPPTISSTSAVVAAIRAATGRPLTRVPVRPEHIVGLPGPESQGRPPAVAGRTGPPGGRRRRRRRQC